MGGTQSNKLLTNIHGYNLQCLGVGFNHSKNKGPWERWTCEQVKLGHYYISNDAHNVRLSASNDGKTINPTKNRDKWEVWHIEPNLLGQYFVKSAHGKYLGQDSTGRLYQTTNRGFSETWKIE